MRKLLLIIFMICFCTIVSADEVNPDIPICVTVNGKYIDFNSEPLLIDSVTYLPARFFCEALKAEVDWIDESQTVIIYHKNNVLEFNIGKNDAYINGIKESFAGYARLIDNKTYLPLRFIAEKLGGIVKWNSKYYTAEITLENADIEDEIIAERNYTNDEIYWLAKIISAESEAEPLKGKVAVGNVILNRVASTDFPDTIFSVIFDKKHGVQFQPTANGSIYKEAVQEAYLAAKLCLNGYNVIEDCKYFLNPKKATNFWIPNNKNYYTTIGNHDFYY